MPVRALKMVVIDNSYISYTSRENISIKVPHGERESILRTGGANEKRGSIHRGATNRSAGSFIIRWSSRGEEIFREINSIIRDDKQLFRKHELLREGKGNDER